MTKILVIKRKKIYMYVIAIALAVLLLLLLINGKSDKPANSSLIDFTAENDTYIPGVYKTILTLGDYNTELYIYVDNNRVKKLTLEDDNSFIKTLYPLAEQTVASINNELDSKSFSELLTKTDTSYTEELILSSAKEALENTAAE